MNSRDRLLTAFRGGTPDRVPVATWFGLPLLHRVTGQTPGQMFDAWTADPCNTIIALQEAWGFDPILITFNELEDEVINWPAGYAIRPAGQIFEARLDNLKVMTEEVRRYRRY